MAARTRSDRLRSELSPEVVYYLQSRGYATPVCTPLIRTPEPRSVRGAVFDPALVDVKIAALKCLRHTQGKWAGRPIEPTSEQVAFIIAPVFGWVAPNAAGDLVRIIRDVYIEMPRKGGKTSLIAALAMVLAFADGEPGAQVILGAGSRDQAGQAFKPIAAVAKSSKVLIDAGVKVTRAQIEQESSQSVVKPVSSRGDLAHGANVHCGLVDELHVHKSPDLLEAIESGTGARTQPLVFIITTADDGQTTSVYAQRRTLIEKVAGRVLKAPAMYGAVFAAEDSDDPFAESTWAKANLLYPVTPSREFMMAAADKAKANPVALASFLRLHLGIRAKQGSRFFDLDRWDRNASMVDWDRLKHRRAFGGVDLASVSDLTALVWLVPDEEGFDVMCRFYLPESSVPALDARTQRNASGWATDGFLTVTPGDVTDYDWIERDIRADMSHLSVDGIGYDPWNSSQLVNNLTADEVPMVTVRQGVASLSAPLKELDRLVRRGTSRAPLLRHGGNPVLRWMADNLRPYSDANGNIKPDKAASMDKIDGISALTIAMAVQMAADPEFVSAYSEAGHEVEVI